MKALVYVILLNLALPIYFLIWAIWYGGFKYSQHHQEPFLFFSTLTGRARYLYEAVQYSVLSLIFFVPMFFLSIQVILPIQSIVYIALIHFVAVWFWGICHVYRLSILRSAFSLLAWLSIIILAVLNVKLA